VKKIFIYKKQWIKLMSEFKSLGVRRLFSCGQTTGELTENNSTVSFEVINKIGRRRLARTWSGMERGNLGAGGPILNVSDPDTWTQGIESLS
jgi:hypothetical protein